MATLNIWWIKFLKIFMDNLHLVKETTLTVEKKPLI